MLGLNTLAANIDRWNGRRISNERNAIRLSAVLEGDNSLIGDRAAKFQPICGDAVSYTHLTLPTTPYV